MATFEEISKKFIEREAEEKRLREKSQRLLLRAEKIRDNNHWTDKLIKPLWEEVENILKDEFEFEENKRFIPMGLCCRVSLFPKHKATGKLTICCFVPGNISEGGLRYDTEKRNTRFAEGTIGALSDVGKESKPVDSIEQIVEHIRNQVEK